MTDDPVRMGCRPRQDDTDSEFDANSDDSDDADECDSESDNGGHADGEDEEAEGVDDTGADDGDDDGNEKYTPEQLEYFKNAVDFFDSRTSLVRGAGDRREGAGVLQYMLEPWVHGPLMPFARSNVACDSAHRSGLLNPKVHFVIPELLFGAEFYPSGKPACPWHGPTCKCVGSEGIRPRPRTSTDTDCTIAVFRKKYKCTRRKEENPDATYNFSSCDPESMKFAPRPVQMWWLMHGHVFTARKAITMRHANSLYALKMNNLSLSGFRRSVVEMHKRAHAYRASIWHEAVQCRHEVALVQDVIAAEREFPRWSHKDVPCTKWFRGVLLRRLQERNEFRDRHMANVVGSILQVDRCYKPTKVVRGWRRALLHRPVQLDPASSHPRSETDSHQRRTTAAN